MPACMGGVGRLTHRQQQHTTSRYRRRLTRNPNRTSELARKRRETTVEAWAIVDSRSGDLTLRPSTVVQNPKEPPGDQMWTDVVRIGIRRRFSSATCWLCSPFLASNSGAEREKKRKGRRRRRPDQKEGRSS